MIVSETNEVDIKEETYTIYLRSKYETKHTLSIRGKFKKTI